MDAITPKSAPNTLSPPVDVECESVVPLAGGMTGSAALHLEGGSLTLAEGVLWILDVG